MRNQEEIIKNHWFIDQGKKFLLIVASDKKIYKGRLKKGQPQQQAQLGINKNIIPKSLFSIPYNYIKEIHYEIENPVVEIFLRRSASIDLKVHDQEKREEIFNYFKTQLRSTQYDYQEHSWFMAIKKPLIAFVFVNILLAWSYLVAGMIQNGEDLGTQLVIVLGVAGLGTKIILYIFVIVNIILAFLFYLKIKNSPKKHVLIFDERINYQIE